MVDEYVLSLIVFIIFTCLTAFIVWFEKKWYAPSPVFSIVWCSVVGFSLLSAPDYYFSSKALLFIMSLVFTFFSGSSLLTYLHASDIPVLNDSRIIFQRNETRLFQFLFFSALSGFISVILLLRDAGIEMDSFFDFEKLKIISAELSRHRYQGAHLSSSTMFSLSLAYSGSLCGGWLFAHAKSLQKKLSCLIVLLPVFLFTFIYTARAVFIFGLVLWLAGFISSASQQQNNFLQFLKKRNILIAVGVCVFVYATFIFTQALRMNMSPFNPEAYGLLMEHLKASFSGNISAFSIWFDNFRFEWSFGFFKNTFAGVYEALGIGIRKNGIYDLQFDVNGRMSLTNIFTVFRFLIDDCTLAGTYILMFVLGFASKFLFIKSAGGSIIHSALLSGILAFLLFSFITSIFAYNTTLFAWCFFVLFIAIFCKR